ncbi:MAG: hypothetical protein LUC22_03165 [Prevotella sp.]|nr:hypothetical protein [Prevotella sp.]
MKRTKLLMMFAALCTALTASAYTVDDTLQFTDEAGNIIPDGTELTVKGAVEDEYEYNIEMDSGLYVLNTSSETVGVGLDLTISRIDNGQLKCCFPSVCQNQTTVLDEYDNGSSTIGAGVSKTLNTEYLPDSYGTCTATFRLRLHDVTYNANGLPSVSNAPSAYGPSITVTFVYDETSLGIDDVRAGAASEPAAYYTLSGERLSAPAKGVNVVKYADGTTAKIIVK